MNTTKKLACLLPGVGVVVSAFILMRLAQNQTGYYGVPAVSCLDSTKPIVQDFSFTLQIMVDGKEHPLSSSIGHDAGTCLREIHTDDASGTVHVQSNDASAAYTLQDFFWTWHQNFSNNLVVGHKLSGNENMWVSVNGNLVPTFESTRLTPNEAIEIIVQ